METTELTRRFPETQEAKPLPPPTRRSRLHRRVGRALLRRMRRVWNKLDWQLMQIGARSGRLSSLYYAFFNRSFDREHRAVLAGRMAWEASRHGPSATSSLLRRNTHRLEKGLLMRPRRSLFALDYIEETMQFYEAAVQVPDESRYMSREELRWAHDVLTEYFTVTGTHPRLNVLRMRFTDLPQPGEVFHRADQPWKPYKRDLVTPPSVAYEDLLTLAWRRRSVRWFEQKPVPRTLIEKAVTVAGLSPSACNRQPFIFRVFDDPALVQEVAVLPGGTKGFHDNFPAIVVLVGELRNYYGERDRHLIYVDASLAAMSFVLAAETLGLSTCCINWPDIEEHEAQADELLQLEPDQRPIMFIAVGYPDPEGMVAYSQKKPSHQLCRYNFE